MIWPKNDAKQEEKKKKENVGFFFGEFFSSSRSKIKRNRNDNRPFYLIRYGSSRDFSPSYETKNLFFSPTYVFLNVKFTQFYVNSESALVLMMTAIARFTPDQFLFFPRIEV